MYGGLELAEMITFKKQFPYLKTPIIGKPYIKQRGLKFNIPLDIRTPSYQDAGDSAQQNIAEMWDMDFWKAYLDMMARNRYNVLTLWNPHPFPSMIKLEEYPYVALDNVCGTSFPLDTDRIDEPNAKFIAGCGVSQEVLDNLLVLKEMTINEKITFWREVMSYAKNRGVDVYFITWNIWMNSLAPSGWYRSQENLKGNEGKYGINNDQTNPKTIAYLRQAVKEFILTYPDLAGIGLTAGENMEDRDDEFDREKWLWNTYGQGVEDAKKEQPEREVKFIHRYWQSDVGKMKADFIDKYPDKIDLSFKYARARMYATAKPQWANEYIEELKKYNLKSWWNIRNDDIFYFRWGNPTYTSAFIKNLPSEEFTAGYFMGSDGYVWGREFISKHPKQPRELEIDKHWYNFMLWGRMGYNPNLSNDLILGMLAEKYPNVNVEELQKVWVTASEIPSLVTKFHWNSWDFMWAVEGCLDLRKGFHTVEDFINNPTMDFTGVLSIPAYLKRIQTNNPVATNETTPLQLADVLEAKATMVLDFTEKQQIVDVSSSYSELLYDLKAWAYMGNYYANKIRGAFYLETYKQGLGLENKEKSIKSLETALKMWKLYAEAASRNYKPQFLAKTRTIDWNALTKDVEKDIEIVKNGH
ncbi:carbohydrate-binding family 6 protein [Lutibacter sp. HS1-25]|nr:carbohydrate-binding family 6 protein [Lutibacter sp. HS1-25]